MTMAAIEINMTATRAVNNTLTRELFFCSIIHYCTDRLVVK
jgi:hypothetical protein